jgi:hypothetical protein
VRSAAADVIKAILRGATTSQSTRPLAGSGR